MTNDRPFPESTQDFFGYYDSKTLPIGAMALWEQTNKKSVLDGANAAVSNARKNLETKLMVIFFLVILAVLVFTPQSYEVGEHLVSAKGTIALVVVVGIFGFWSVISYLRITENEATVEFLDDFSRLAKMPTFAHNDEILRDEKKFRACVRDLVSVVGYRCHIAQPEEADKEEERFETLFRLAVKKFGVVDEATEKPADFRPGGRFGFTWSDHFSALRAMKDKPADDAPRDPRVEQAKKGAVFFHHGGLGAAKPA